LDYPNYTKPRIFNKKEVPNVLLSGNHSKIHIWRLKESLGKTWMKRPDLLKKNILSQEEKNLLKEFQENFTKKNNKI
ncbi:MAG: tRNA (guanosine(37)-N1)-methyltransferase TrmD, partial [Buchnera aphidicola]|nr:tRNA (guanosine(37)-N1)-methyltransferase TrmD [Buchnera aphidicola]